MKIKIIGAFLAFALSTNMIKADLLNSLIWAGTKAVAVGTINSLAKAGENNSKRRTKTRKKRVRKKTVVYHCSAKALRASGWTESTSLAKAKRGAIRQCKIRRVSNKPCIIQNCYKK